MSKSKQPQTKSSAHLSSIDFNHSSSTRKNAVSKIKQNSTSKDDDEIKDSSFIIRLRKFFKFDPYMQILDIDFDQHWYKLLFRQKLYLSLNLLNQIVYSTVSSLFPLILGFAVAQGRLDWILFAVCSRIIMRVCTHILFRYHPLYEINIIESIKVAAYKRLITVDPQYHATRSSGQIISKINRGSQGVWSVIDIALFSLITLLISLVSVTVSIFIFSPIVSILVLIVFLMLLGWSIYGFRLRTKLHFPVRVDAQDKATAVNVESMQQALYIRASFSSKEQIKIMEDRTHEFMVQQAIGWRWSGWLMAPTQIVYLTAMLGFTILLWNQNLQPSVLLGALLAIANLGTSLYDVGRVVDKFLQGVEDANDLFDFIRNFGIQSFPVLESDEV